MSNLKQLRDRIRGVKATKKITKAMEMVAAAKFRKMKSLLSHSQEYFNILSEMCGGMLKSFSLQDELTGIESLAFNLNTQSNLVTTKQLIIILSSDRGLCGSLNSNLIRRVKKDILLLKEQNIDYELIIFGKKAYEGLKNMFGNTIINFHHMYLASIINAEQILGTILATIQDSSYNTCKIYFSKFINTVKQVDSINVLFPIPSKIIESSKYSYELEGSKITEKVIKLYFVAIIYSALVEQIVSEECARMVTMENATNNADTIINHLTLQLNRLRQSKITSELIEIIAGAEVI